MVDIKTGKRLDGSNNYRPKIFLHPRPFLLFNLQWSSFLSYSHFFPTKLVSVQVLCVPPSWPDLSRARELLLSSVLIYSFAEWYGKAKVIIYQIDCYQSINLGHQEHLLYNRRHHHHPYIIWSDLIIWFDSIIQPEHLIKSDLIIWRDLIQSDHLIKSAHQVWSDHLNWFDHIWSSQFGCIRLKLFVLFKNYTRAAVKMLVLNSKTCF